MDEAQNAEVLRSPAQLRSSAEGGRAWAGTDRGRHVRAVFQHASGSDPPATSSPSLSVCLCSCVSLPVPSHLLLQDSSSPSHSATRTASLLRLLSSRRCWAWAAGGGWRAGRCAARPRTLARPAGTELQRAISSFGPKPSFALGTVLAAPAASVHGQLSAPSCATALPLTLTDRATEATPKRMLLLLWKRALLLAAAALLGLYSLLSAATADSLHSLPALDRLSTLGRARPRVAILEPTSYHSGGCSLLSPGSPSHPAAVPPVGQLPGPTLGREPPSSLPPSGGVHPRSHTSLPAPVQLCRRDPQLTSLAPHPSPRSPCD